MNWYYFLILVFMPIIGNGENCTILWNLDNFQTRMKIKMCIEPIEESLFFDNMTGLLNLSKLYNFSNETKSQISMNVTKTHTIINETKSQISMNVTKNHTIINETNLTLSPSPIHETDFNYQVPNITENITTPSTSDVEIFDEVKRQSVPSPVIEETAPSPHYIIENASNIFNSNTTSDVNKTLNRYPLNNIQKFDTVAFVSITTISLFFATLLFTYVWKKRKRKNVQPLCKFRKGVKKEKSLERPKDYIIEFMTENPINPDKNKELKTMDNV